MRSTFEVKKCSIVSGEGNRISVTSAGIPGRVLFLRTNISPQDDSHREGVVRNQLRKRECSRKRPSVSVRPASQSFVQMYQPVRSKFLTNGSKWKRFKDQYQS